jgi:hypothetical protein
LRGYDIYYRWDALAGYVVLPVLPARNWLHHVYIGITGGLVATGELNTIFLSMRANMEHTPSLPKPLATECLASRGEKRLKGLIPSPSEPHSETERNALQRARPHVLVLILAHRRAGVFNNKPSFKAKATLQNKALTVANTIMNMFYKKDPESILAARRLAEVLGEKWEERGVGVYESGPKETQVWGIGHCHIDMAWYVKWIARRST